jgi:hypothetical protein
VASASAISFALSIAAAQISVTFLVLVAIVPEPLLADYFEMIPTISGVVTPTPRR